MRDTKSHGCTEIFIDLRYLISSKHENLSHQFVDVHIVLDVKHLRPPILGTHFLVLFVKVIRVFRRGIPIVDNVEH